MQDYLAQFANYLKHNNRSESTIHAYTNDLNQIVSITGDLLPKVTTKDLLQLITTLKYRYKLSPQSVSRKINSLKKFFDFLVSVEIIEVNPAESISHPKYKVRSLRVLTKNEYNSIISASVDNIKLLTIFECFVQTGLKISELSDLKIKDLDKKLQFIIIAGRKVPLNLKIKQLLDQYLKLVGKTLPYNYPLFSTHTGKSIEVRNIRSGLDRIFEKAKVKNLCVNDLRNTFIVYQLASGMELKTVSKLAGHKNITTTKKYLTNALRKQIKKNFQIPKVFPEQN